MKETVKDKLNHDLKNCIGAIMAFSSPPADDDAIASINRAARRSYAIIKTLDAIEMDGEEVRFDTGACLMFLPKGYCEDKNLTHHHCDDTKLNEHCKGCDFQEPLEYPEKEEIIDGV